MKFKTFYKQYAESRHPVEESSWNAALHQYEELRIAVDLMKEIKSKFPDKEIYIVGGVPRDILMGAEIDDVDLATNIPFADMGKHFEVRNISKNDSQPVYDIEYKGAHFDLAAFREDDQQGLGRQNNVATTVDSFETDTKRRDITLGALGLTEDGVIVDYQGGIDDIKNGIIRAVGNAKERFKEDATRILRVFRFAAKMDFDIDPDTERAAVELKHFLQDASLISQESIAKEFYKIAKSGQGLANFLVKLQNTGILHKILPEFTNMEGFMHNPKHHPEGGSSVLGHILECLRASPYKDPIINLAVLFHDFGKGVTKGEKGGFSTYYAHEAAGVPIVDGIFGRLRFPDLGPQEKKNILAAVAKHMLVHQLDTLNVKTLTKLILDPSWEIVKAVGYCDEASRGTPLFNHKEFWAKIGRAEDKVSALGGNQDELRLKIKQYIDGNRLLQWFPELSANKKIIKDVMTDAQDYILDVLNRGETPTEDNIKAVIRDFLDK